jgi:predicted O-methyltransferase YrrM
MDKRPVPSEYAEDDIQMLARAFFRSRILLTAYELGVFTALGEGGKTSAEAAAALGTDARATDRLMNALAVLGLLRKEDGRFANGEAAARYLVRGEPEYMAGLGHAVNLWDSWSTLTEAVRAGTAVFEWPAGEAGEERTEAFIAAMHHGGSARAERTVATLDLAGVKRVLDVGGASGAYAAAFVRAREGITATVFDLPQVTPLTRRYLDEAGLSDRIDVAEGDAVTDDLPAGYDLVWMSQLLHSNSPRENEALIARGAAALERGGRLVIQDFVVNEGRTGPPQPVIFALNMLVNTAAGDTYAESEIRGWMEAAGLAGVERRDTGFETTLITGKKP